MQKMKNKGRKFKKRQKKISLLGFSYESFGSHGECIMPVPLSYFERKHLDRINHESMIALRRRKPMPVDFPQGYPDRFRYVNFRKAACSGLKFPIYTIDSNQSVL